MSEPSLRHAAIELQLVQELRGIIEANPGFSPERIFAAWREWIRQSDAQDYLEDSVGDAMLKLIFPALLRKAQEQIGNPESS